MENAKINGWQLFLLINLFELGTVYVSGIGIEAKQEAWLAILLGTIGGIVLILIYYQLYIFYPDQLMTTYLKKIVGNIFGTILGFVYVVYFIYLTSRVLRDFGVLVISISYPETPLFIINALMIIVVMYAVKKGIEVIARTGELNFVLLYIMAFFGFIFIVVSGLIDFNRLKPFLENGFMPIVKEFATETLYIPFGEAIAFAFIFPYLNNNKKGRILCVAATAVSGIDLAMTMAINIAVLGIHIAGDAPFPLLATIKEIHIVDFIERLDVFFVVGAFIGAFFKIAIFFYVSTVATADLFKLKSHTMIVHPIGIIVVFLSVSIASNFTEHLKEGLDILTLYYHLPLQVILPILLLIIAIIKNRKKNRSKIIMTK